jgi:hypothetical protein
MTKKKVKAKKNEGDDVFGIISHARTCEDEVVILKSKARTLCMERDGMSYDEFEEHWDYNIAGSKGQGSYSVVDDEISHEMLGEMIEEDPDIFDPHRVVPKAKKKATVKAKKKVAKKMKPKRKK